MEDIYIYSLIVYKGYSEKLYYMFLMPELL